MARKFPNDIIDDSDANESGTFADQIV